MRNSFVQTKGRSADIHYVEISKGYRATPCYKQFLPGLEEPEKSADAEKSEIFQYKYTPY